MNQSPNEPPPEAARPYGYAPGYGAPPYGSPVSPDHPQATLVLVLGIVGLVACQVVAPFAWVMGNRVVREIDDSRGGLGGRSSAQVGQILGIVGTVLLIVSVVVILFIFVFFAAALSGPA